MPTIDIENPIQLDALLRRVAREVVEAVSKDLLEIFINDYVVKYVYEGHKPNSFYDPTGEFEHAWEFTEVKELFSEVTTELWYNWMNMATFNDTSQYTHTSASKNWPSDTRENLADWLNRKVSSSHRFSVLRNERYWELFIQEQVRQDRIGKLFKQHFASRGITV